MSIRTAITLLLAGLVVTLTGCGGNSPEDVTRNFYHALGERDTDRAVALILPGERDDARIVVVFVGEIIHEQGGVERVETRDVEIDADRAELMAEIFFGNGKTETDRLTLQRDGRRWYIAEGWE